MALQYCIQKCNLPQYILPQSRPLQHPSTTVERQDLSRMQLAHHELEYISILIAVTNYFACPCSHSLPSRDIIADSIETVMCGQWYDANISLPGCDKNMPGVILAMARFNRPSIMVYGGTIKPGCSKIDGRDLLVSHTFEAYGEASAVYIFLTAWNCPKANSPAVHIWSSSCLGSGLPPWEAPVMIAEKRKLSFIFSLPAYILLTAVGQVVNHCLCVVSVLTPAIAVKLTHAREFSVDLTIKANPNFRAVTAVTPVCLQAL